MMYCLIRLFICCALLWETVGAQVKIMAVTPPRNGDRVNLTCTISTFTSPATWDDPGGTLSTCFNSGTCSPQYNGLRYNFSATSSSIDVMISNFNSTADTFFWKCHHLGVSDTYRIKYAIPVTNVKLENNSGHILNSTIHIVRGKSMDFRCSTSPSGSRPRATFRWYKKERNQLPSVITDQSISNLPEPQPIPGQPEVDLLISYSTLTLQGNTVIQNVYIFCEGRDVTNRSNYVQSGEIQLNIVYPPRVQLFPNTTEYNVTLGTRNFSFNCNIIEANPLPQTNRYIWLHETSVIPEQSVSSYTLPNVQQSDNGAYSCRAENAYGTGTSDSLNFNVQYGPTISGLDDIDVEEGGTVNVACKVSGHPTPSVNWTRSDKVVSNSSLLMITSISRLNGGNYTCTASSVIQPTGQSPIPMHTIDTLRINVLYGPGNSSSINPNISVYEVEEDKTAQAIICSAICNPSCSYKWMRNNTHISSQGILSLGVVHRNMSGRYDCEALNKVLGQKSSTISLEVKVQYAPDVFVSYSGSTMINSTIVLTCIAFGDPSQYTFHEWVHTVGEIEIRRLTGLNTANTSILALSTISIEDMGTYVCTVDNSITGLNGQIIQTGHADILVHGSPFIENKNSIFIGMTNKSARIEIPFYSNPSSTTVKFYMGANTVEVTNTSDTLIFLSSFLNTFTFYGKEVLLNGQIAVLHFRTVKTTDYGEYTAILLNDIGNTSIRIVFSSGEPETPGNFHITDVQEKQVTLQWLSGDHMGFDQTFVVQISMDDITWTNASLINAEKKEGWFSATITGLKSNTAYYFRLYSFNVNGKGDFTHIKFATRTLKESASSLDIGASLGIGFGGFFLGVVGTISVIIIKKRITETPKYSSTSEADMSTDMQTYANTRASSSLAPSHYEELQQDRMEKTMYDRI